MANHNSPANACWCGQSEWNIESSLTMAYRSCLSSFKQNMHKVSLQVSYNLFSSVPLAWIRLSSKFILTWFVWNICIINTSTFLENLFVCNLTHVFCPLVDYPCTVGALKAVVGLWMLYTKWLPSCYNAQVFGRQFIISL